MTGMRTMLRKKRFFRPFAKALHIIGMRTFIKRFKRLHGDPHCISLGMAIGVFIGTTPTFPFHTALAVLLALLLRGSPPAAALGVWFGNPLTMPFFYIGSFKVGMLLLGRELPAIALDQLSFAVLAKLGLDVTCALMAGGAIIGLPFAVAAYCITYQLTCRTLRGRQQPETLK